MISNRQKVGCAVGLMAILMGGTSLRSPASAASGWVQVTTDRGNRIWYVDSGSIQGTGRFRYFWSYIVGGPPFPEAGKLAHSSAYYLSVDCQQKRYRLRHARSLDENTNLIKEYNFGDSQPLAPAQPGSGEEASINFVCSRR